MASSSRNLNVFVLSASFDLASKALPKGFPQRPAQLTRVFEMPDHGLGLVDAAALHEHHKQNELIPPRGTEHHASIVESRYVIGMSAKKSQPRMSIIS
jgi:hypothetical protein